MVTKGQIELHLLHFFSEKAVWHETRRFTIRLCSKALLKFHNENIQIILIIHF